MGATAEKLSHLAYQAARVGLRVPDVPLGQLSHGTLDVVHTHALFAGRRAIVIGIPGAFTPICEGEHLPGFIANAAKLKQAGFDMICCIAPNDPWVLSRWAQEVDPGGAIRFLSDGNLAFARALGLNGREDGFFLGERSRRYVMTLDRAVIQKLRVDDDILRLNCTTADAVMLD